MENYIEYAKVPGIEAYENQFVALYQFLEEKFGLQIDETRDRIFSEIRDLYGSPGSENGAEGCASCGAQSHLLAEPAGEH